MINIKKRLQKFKDNQAGSIVIEAAIFLPILALFLVFSFETSRYILINQKLSRASASLNDIMARVNNPETQINDYVNIAIQTMDPFYAPTQMRVFSSVMTKPESSSSAEIIWQYSGGGTLSASSQYGIEGGVPNMPDDFTWRDNETILSTEIYYQYNPFFNLPLLESKTLYVSAFNKPRLQNLTTLEN